MIDWKHEKNYHYPNESLPEVWAWEFLRRNQEYQLDYLQWSEAQTYLKAKTSALSGLLPWAERLKRLEDRNDTKYDPPRSEDESLDGWEKRWQGNGIVPKTFSLAEWVQHRWQLACPVNPDLDCNEDVVFFEPEFPARVTYEDVGRYFEEHVDDEVETAEPYTVPKEGYAVIAFDLKRPLPRQLAVAEKILKDLAPVRCRAKREVTEKEASQYRDQLRVLDALASGATSKEIAARLFPEDLDNFNPNHGEQHVWRVKKSAQQMVNGGYRRLLLWGPNEL